MARGIFAHELNDPDFIWLLSNYKESNPHSTVLDSPGLPVMVLSFPEPSVIPALPEPEPIENIDSTEK